MFLSACFHQAELSAKAYDINIGGPNYASKLAKRVFVLTYINIKTGQPCTERGFFMGNPMDQPQVDYEAALEIASHEAFVRRTYKDSKGVLTWCVGMTDTTGHSVECYVGKPSPLSIARKSAWVLKNYAVGVYRAIEGHHLTKAQFAPAMSVHRNTGAIERASWVTKFKAGDIAGVKKDHSELAHTA